MRLSLILSKLGLILFIVGACMFLPMLVSIYFNEAIWKNFLLSATITMLCGGGLAIINKGKGSLKHREGLAIVSFSWLLVGLFGALPYLISSTFPNFIDAFFETVSGFTTTGATVLLDVETTEKGILFWRSLTQWLGGMGIVILFVALLSSVGTDALHIFSAELTSPTFTKIRPRIRETAQVLWLIYLSLTGVLFLLLYFLGMSPFDALNHAFTTVSTGGFSTKNASIGAFENPFIHWTIIAFMFLGGVNFALYYQGVKQRTLSRIFRDEETLVYIFLICIASIIILFNLYKQGIQIRISDLPFQVISLTSTGFTTINLEQWPSLARFILIFLMLIGASTGSTSGSIKIGRYIIMFKSALAELKRLSHPRAIISIKLNKKPVSSNLVVTIYQFFFLYIAIGFLSVIILGLSQLDIMTSICAVLTTISNVGPGLGLMGSISQFATLPSFAKLLLVFLMLLGRLEIFTLLVLFLPNIWEK